MIKIYRRPYLEVIEMTEKVGVMQGDGSVGEIGGGDAMGKEYHYIENEDVSDLWGDVWDDGIE